MNPPNWKRASFFVGAALLLISIHTSVVRAGSKDVTVVDVAKAYAECLRACAESNLKDAEAHEIRMRARQIELQGDWQQIEVDELRRLTALLKRDEREARRTLASLESRSSALGAFFSGRITARNYQAFRWASRHVPASESLRRYYEAPVAASSADDFTCDLEMFAALGPDGSLRPAPPVLRRSDPNHPVERGKLAFHKQWKGVLALLRYDSVVSYETITGLERALDEWKQAASQTAVRRTVIALQQSKYLWALGNLIDSLYSPEKVELLRTFVVQGGFAFPGGTCRELLEHMRTFKLSTHPGSNAQLALGELGTEYLGAVHREIEAKTAMLNALRDRSPAMTAGSRDAIKSGVSLKK